MCSVQDHLICLTLLIISMTFRSLSAPDVGPSVLICDAEHISSILVCGAASLFYACLVGVQVIVLYKYCFVAVNSSVASSTPWPLAQQSSQTLGTSWTGFEENSKDMSAQNLLQELSHLHDSKSL